MTLRSNNPRTDSDILVRLIAASIEGFGFMSPVLTDASGPVVAAHGRVRAAKQHGMDDLPTIRIDHLAEDQIRTVLLTERRLSDCAGCDQGLLALAREAPAVFSLGFDSARPSLAPIRSPIPLGESNPDREPNPAERWVALEPDSSTVCRHHELCQIASQRLPCGGSLDGKSQLRALGTKDLHLEEGVFAFGKCDKPGDECAQNSAPPGPSKRSPIEVKS